MLVAVTVPLLFLYAIHWLDLYGTDRPRIIVDCVLWGLIAFVISFAINHFFLDIVGVSRPFLSTRIAPFVEEIAKAGILVFLVRRRYLHNAVDGAIYGFASGIGFAAIENLRYLQLYPNSGLALMVLRDFSSALSHGTATAMTGIALGSLSLGSMRARRASLVLGLSGAMGLHYLWNNFAYFSPFARALSEWILVGVALAGVAAICLAILWNLRHEREVLRAELGSTLRISAGETEVLRHLDDADRLLAPIAKRFGAATATRVRQFLQVEARLELAEACGQRATDDATRTALRAEVDALKAELDVRRRTLGLYVMIHVRSLLPETKWSVWARAAQHDRDAGGNNVWDALAAKCGRSRDAGRMYPVLQAALAARTHAPEPVEHLSERLRACVHFVTGEVTVTAQHAAQRLGWHEADVRAMLHDLVARGYLHHRAGEAGEDQFHARAPAGRHVWHAARQARIRERPA